MSPKARRWNRFHHIVNAIAKRVSPLENLEDPKRYTSLMWRFNQWVFAQYRDDLTRKDLRDLHTLPEP